jgi:hypothetical protein
MATVIVKTAKYTPVQKLRVTHKDNGSISMEWNVSKAPLPAGAVTLYEVFQYIGNSPVSLGAVESLGAGIFSLYPNTKYKFAVRAVTWLDGRVIESQMVNISAKTLK